MLILLTGLICGSLDLGAAVLLFSSRTKQPPSLLLKSITSAALGPRALRGGYEMALAGLSIHYLIALFWTGFYFTFLPRMIPCSTILIHAIVYGMFVWVIMNVLVLPLSKFTPRPFSALLALINMAILMLTIGLPCAFVANRYGLVGFGL